MGDGYVPNHKNRGNDKGNNKNELEKGIRRKENHAIPNKMKTNQNESKNIERSTKKENTIMDLIDTKKE